MKKLWLGGLCFLGSPFIFKALFSPVFQDLQDMRQEVTGESTEFCFSWICYVGEPQLHRK